ncbi:acetoacetate--CoA ligase [Congregibacter sp.]|uniref:acetoacetate--CoA ligase n=1 Tax=Congregibacter sp. TaxID=2744308 RepID=UPI003F6D28EA
MDQEQALWQPSSDRIANSPLSRFEAFIGDRVGYPSGRPFEGYLDLHRWSVTEPDEFWQCVWDFTDVRASRDADNVLADGDRFPGARWFDGARLNYAENLLDRQLDGVALIGRLENGERREVSWSELHRQVALTAAALRESGVQKGDRVAGMLPNVPETVIAMLATASIGALWSSCSPDFGVSGVLDRFGQIQPKVLIACDGYYYNGKAIDCSAKIAEVASRLSPAATVVVPLLDVPVAKTVSWPAYLKAQQTPSGSAPELQFEQLPFDHPLFIMYSSGTTGAPKCIVHSAGGTLLQHLKEHQLHGGLAPGDVLFYFTTCGWMMWNWMVGGLASGVTLVLYDGSPFYPGPETLFDIADEDGINVFGVGAKYISALEKQGLKPAKTHKLKTLRTVLSTGSPLSHESFRYIYRDVKKDVCLSSISGGTDIISCFVLGNECLPVYEGELQCPGLGMAVEVWDEQGKPVTGAKGEMVCVKPFPSAPVGFWNDPDGKRYHDAYFASYDGIWAHGDYAEITSSGGMIIHGRSDAVLNPGGVRIGTAEIYRQVEKIDAVMDSVCIGQNWDDDVRVVLFVVLKEGETLTEELATEIRLAIRKENTPRHVPAKILAVTDIPRTRSGKIAEIPVRKVVNGETIDNTESLANPESLSQFKNRPELES